jgi:putative endopeptidase
MKRLMITMMIVGAAISGCKETKKAPALDLANLNTEIAAGDDFYEYATGGWQKAHPLTGEYSRYGSFDMLRESSLDNLKSIVDEVSQKENEAGTNAEKIATFYSLGMDSAKLNADGFAPLAEQWAEVYAISDVAGFTQMVAKLHHIGINPYFAFFVSADEMNSDQNIAQLYQSGLNMGDRDYYLEDNENINNIRNAYTTYMQKVFTLAGFTAERATEAAKNVLDIETKIAEVSYTRVMLRDSHLNYNKMLVEDFKNISKLIDWTAYFETLGMGGKFTELNVSQKDYYPRLDEAMSQFTLDQQKDYLAFSLLNAATSYLSDDFAAANFEFYGKTMSGQEEMRPRWKRVLATVDGALSEAMGQLYVERYFPETSKEKMITLVENLRIAMGQRIDNLTWMSDETKAKAHEKLGTFAVKIGYPDTWRDYSNLNVADDSYWANIVRSNTFEMDFNFSDLGKPVDKERWLMSPQTVNAYYTPTTNEICFPAAILQPPFFNADADDAINYGGIGVVIGHEMTHGFDDQGRNYDAKGNLAGWWTDEDAVKFDALAQVLVKQYNEIVIADGVNANGELTLGENIADSGGLLISYQAFRNSLNGTEPEPIDNFSADQRFYLSYASIWAQNIRPEEELRLTKLDVHSLGKWRVNAALRNIDAFYTAFDVNEDNLMWLAPADRVVIW